MSFGRGVSFGCGVLVWIVLIGLVLGVWICLGVGLMILNVGGVFIVVGGVKGLRGF